MARKSFSLLYPMALAAAFALPAAAQEVYRWVDDSGVVHFSDRPPASASTEVSTVAVQPGQLSSNHAASDVYDVEGTAARTQARRDQLAEQRSARAAQPGASSAPRAEYQGQAMDYGTPYRYPVGSRPPRPDRPVRPEQQPIADGTATVRPVSRPRRN